MGHGRQSSKIFVIVVTTIWIDFVACGLILEGENENTTVPIVTEEVSINATTQFTTDVPTNVSSEVTTEIEQTTTETPPQFTAEQLEKLALFREKIVADLPHDYMKADGYLVRWLVARDWDVEQAEKMLRDNLQWRVEQNMDTIMTEDWSDMEEEFPYTKDCEDKMGRPIGTMSMASWDIRGASYTGKLQRLHRYVYKLMEEATNGVLKRQAEGKNVTNWKVLMNMDGFGLRMHACTSCLSFHQAFVSTYENHYPGYADAIVLINTPATFRVVITVVKPFLSSRTKDVIRVFGRNEKIWGEYLDQEIDKSQRRLEFGGTKEDPPPSRKRVY